MSSLVIYTTPIGAQNMATSQPLNSSWSFTKDSINEVAITISFETYRRYFSPDSANKNGPILLKD